MLEWLLAVAFATVPMEVNCLAQNVYFEARNQPIEGQYAVAEVTLNRVKDSTYPSSICEVIKQKHQFSWYRPNAVPKEKEAWKVAKIIALASLREPTHYVSGAQFFHHKSIKPSWARNMKKVRQIGDHVFYRI